MSIAIARLSRPLAIVVVSMTIAMSITISMAIMMISRLGISRPLAIMVAIVSISMSRVSIAIGRVAISRLSNSSSFSISISSGLSISISYSSGLSISRPLSIMVAIVVAVGRISISMAIISVSR